MGRCSRPIKPWFLWKESRNLREFANDWPIFDPHFRPESGSVFDNCCSRSRLTNSPAFATTLPPTEDVHLAVAHCCSKSRRLAAWTTACRDTAGCATHHAWNVSRGPTSCSPTRRLPQHITMAMAPSDTLFPGRVGTPLLLTTLRVVSHVAPSPEWATHSSARRQSCTSAQPGATIEAGGKTSPWAATQVLN
jgi:hypothetical protein